MSAMSDKEPTVPPPVRLSRRYEAPRALVFRAWSSADHVRRWFAPAVFSVPESSVELRPGGPFEVCMRAPDGTRFWTRGLVKEVIADQRLVLDLWAEDAEGTVLFHAWTEVDFADDGENGGTRLDVTQTYTLLDPRAAAMVGGASAGWASTLEKLGEEVARIAAGHPATSRSATHDTFSLERTWSASPAAVFHALSDAATKSLWFGGEPDRFTVLERAFDCRVGGRERLKGRWASGVVTDFDAVYLDVVPDARLVYAYRMGLDGVQISISLATLEIEAAPAGGATLRITEQGVFLDGYEDAGSRREGTGQLLDRLGQSLAGQTLAPSPGPHRGLERPGKVPTNPEFGTLARRETQNGMVTESSTVKRGP